MGQALLVIIFCVTLICSCKSGDKRLISDRDLVSVLTEIYVADGILTIPRIRSLYSEKDSTSNYLDILKRHKLTKQRMDNTLSYYFSKNPKKLQNIYDQVLTRLTERQTLIEKAIPTVHQPRYNLWPGKDYVNVPESGVKDPIWFSVQVKDTGNYILDFTATIFDDDQSINLRTTVFFWRGDSSKTENRLYWPEVNLIKDIQARNYSLSKRNGDSTYNHIGGWILNSDPKEGRWEKHAIIQNIRLHKVTPQ
jgi:hypothetical protein